MSSSLGYWVIIDANCDTGMSANCTACPVR